MQTLLIIFSLILHGIAFLVIRSQSVKMNQVQEKAMELRNQSNEMEELLSTYLYEIKEENDRFLAMIEAKELNQSIPTMKSIKPKASVLNSYKKNAKAALNDGSDLNARINSFTPEPIEEMQENPMETSPFVHALALHNSGVSTESIAKELNCGETEVELMLKFHCKDNIMP